MRKPKPVGKNAVFRYAVQYAIRTNDRGIDCSGENQEPDNNDESAEHKSQQLWPDHVHGQSGDLVVLIDGIRTASGINITDSRDETAP